METMSDVYKGEEQMLSLKEEGKLEESAKIGVQIIKAFSHFPMIEREAYKVCFNEISKEEFYEHVITIAKKIVNEYK